MVLTMPAGTRFTRRSWSLHRNARCAAVAESVHNQNCPYPAIDDGVKGEVQMSGGASLRLSVSTTYH